MCVFGCFGGDFILDISVEVFGFCCCLFVCFVLIFIS